MFYESQYQNLVSAFVCLQNYDQVGQVNRLMHDAQWVTAELPTLPPPNPRPLLLDVAETTFNSGGSPCETFMKYSAESKLNRLNWVSRLRLCNMPLSSFAG